MTDRTGVVYTENEIKLHDWSDEVQSMVKTRQETTWLIV